MSDISLPATPIRCQSIHFDKAGEADVLYLTDTEVAAPMDEQVMIKVHYAGVNGPDIAQRRGIYPPPPGASAILGLEVSGEVVACGDAVNQWQVGDKVCALVPGGGYSEYVLTHASHCLAIPSGVSMAQAAAIPETFFTVWSNVFMRGQLCRGERFLVHGGSGGIGSTAILLAKQFGATVIATASTAAKLDYCRKLGADFSFSYQSDELLAQVHSATEERGVDLILDMAGGDFVNLNLKMLASDGRLASIALQRGAKAQVDVFRIMAKRITWFGSTLRPQSDAAKAQITAELSAHVWPLFAQVPQAALVPPIEKIYPLAEAALAHQLMESRQHKGKLVLKVN
ncbi:NAD(P)H-quinone oxidoreductase [Shewanella sp. Scap07]|nr:NAD(P)H-quinone oxidoreductase [Shewanella sp. Scap07]QLE84150.1 NAD(P)H-quinone oxidoreductase [Shewanella sp. Scap07]